MSDEIWKAVTIYQSPFPVAGLYVLANGDDSHISTYINELLQNSEGTSLKKWIRQGVILGEMIREKACDIQEDGVFKGELFDTDAFQMSTFKEKVQTLYSLMPQKEKMSDIFQNFIDVYEIVESQVTHTLQQPLEIEPSEEP